MMYMEIYLHNTLGRKKELFKPIKSKKVGIYSCGPTVYNSAHIGNLRAYIFADILARVFVYNGYKVKHIINITDVGHLVSDDDEGEDKIELQSKKEGHSASEIADFHTRNFFNDLDSLNIDRARIIFPKATKHIREQIDIIKILENKGAVYKTSDGIYFDTSKSNDYGKLADLDVKKLKEGARVAINPEKRNPSDFALWKFSTSKEKRQQEWESPWGIGFPGWHIECSAMSMKYLGEEFDIHTGGIDHIPVHHTNEIAQSETATGKTFVHYWLHSAFVKVNGKKMAKSEGDFITLKTITDKNIYPAAYRYWVLTSDYKRPVNFTWDALAGAQTALSKLQDLTNKYGSRSEPLFKRLLYAVRAKAAYDYRKRFISEINNDLDTPKAIATLWDMIKDDTISNYQKYKTILEFDKVLGLGLSRFKRVNLPADISLLIQKRELRRKNKDWAESDRIRAEIEARGFQIKDTDEGQIITPQK